MRMKLINSQSAADVAATLNTLASSVEKVTAAYQSLQNLPYYTIIRYAGTCR